MSRTLVSAALLAPSGASVANAAGMAIDISKAFNSNLYSFTNGTVYPPAGSTVTIGGSYADDSAAPDVGVVLAG